MKKIFATMLLLMIAVCCISAKDDVHVTLTSGNLHWMLSDDNLVYVIFNYDGLTIEGQPAEDYLRSQSADHLKDWPSDNKKCADFFKERWNELNKTGAKIAFTEANANYMMVIHVTSLDLGSTGAAIFGFNKKDGGCIMSGTVEVYDKSGRMVSQLAVDQLKGKGAKYKVLGSNEVKRRSYTYEELIKNMVVISKF